MLRLAARLPFLFIAGRIYGAEALGRFAYAVLIVEFAAQLATLGLKRGLAQQLAHTDQPHVCVVWDALLVAAIASAVAMGLLMLFPQAMFPNSEITGAGMAAAADHLRARRVGHRAGGARLSPRRRRDRPRPRHRRAVDDQHRRLRLVVHLDPRRPDHRLCAVDGRRRSIASVIPFLKSYGVPRDWQPDPATLWRMARRNMPLAAADAIEWGSRRLDIAILGLFVSPAVVGIYYVAQQVASLPAKLKTSFDPILGPGHHPQPRRRRQERGRQAGAPGRLLGHRRAERGRAGARHSRARR